MLKDLEALFDWGARVASDYPFVGFLVMGFAGGLIATIRMYERAGFSMTWRMLMVRLLMKTVTGVFVGALVYFGCKLAGWSLNAGLITAAICGVFGAEVLELAFVTVAEVARKRLGLSPLPPVKPAGGPGDPGDER